MSIISYVVKTSKGYLAVQGNHYWFEDKPIGWALYSTEEDAVAQGEAHHTAIGTKAEEGFRVERI